MKNFKAVYPNNKAFTLIELILGISIMSILMMCLYSILHFSINASKLNNERDDILLNGRYAASYLKEEIQSADKIIHISKFKNLDRDYPQNIGFVILKETIDEKTNKKTNYNYSTYYLKGDSLIRIACNRGSDNYPHSNFFGGHNKVCSKINKLEKFNYNSNKNVLNIKISLNNGQKNFDFKSDLFLNCPIDLSQGGADE